MLPQVRRVARRLLSAPTFTIVAVLTLALGIGADTAIFSVVDGVLLRSLPFEDADQLLFLTRPGAMESDLSIPDGADLRMQETVLQDVALYLPFWAFDLTGSGEPERVAASVVEPEYFRVLETTPLYGRVLATSDDVEGSERVAVVSEPFWRGRLGADPAVVGSPLRLGGEVFTVVGVMPAEFDFLQAGTDMWLTVADATPMFLESRGSNNFEAIARVDPGVSVAAASAEIETITTRLADAYPDTNQGKIVHGIPLRDRVVGPARTALWVLFGAVGLVLLITCANVANLLLVRASAGEREVAVRMALGGSRWRVAGSALGEAVLLSLAGGALGTLLAWWGARALIALAPAGLPRVDQIGIHPGVLLFTAGLCVATALVFGWVPALHAMRRDPADLLARGGGRGAAGRSGRTLSALVVAEVALAALLLVGSTLLLRSFQSLRHVELGFEPAHVITANLVLPESRYGDTELQDAAFDRILETLESSPGVERAAFILGAPLTAYGSIGNSIAFDDRPPPEPGNRPSARIRLVLGDYFRTMEVPVRRGRAFEETDDAEAPRVAIVNETFARRYWPDEDPVGKRVAALYTPEPEWMTVVGVVADVKQNTLSGPDDYTIYVPYPQRQMAWGRFGTLVARGPGDDATLTRAVKDAVWSVDPAVPFDQIAPLDRLVSDSIAPQRFTSTLVALFAALALVIAVQGLYGILSYAVVQRRGEIGVRMALGARSTDVLKLIVGRGLWLSTIGLVIGIVGSLGLTGLIQSLLFGVEPSDPLTYAVVALVLATTALVASAAPAVRASRVDPARTLRRE